MLSFSRTEWADAAAALLFLAALAGKYSLVPGWGLGFAGVALLTCLWYFVQMGRIIQGTRLGLPKLYAMLVYLGASFNVLAILYHVSNWGGIQTVTVIGLSTLVAYAAWWRLQGSDVGQVPFRAMVYAAPTVAIIALALWIASPAWRYKTFNPASPYVSWQAYQRGFHLSEGYLVDSAGRHIRPVPYLK
jgi:hypothetical protein